jgi:DNA-binding CsgD family transcriptional regulator
MASTARLLRTVKVLRGIHSADELMSVGLPALRSLIGADVASSVAVGPRDAVDRPLFEPLDARERADLAAYAALRHQQPLINEFRRHGVPGALRTSDVISLHDFADLDLYQHFYRPLGIRFQLTVAVPDDAEWTVGYTLSRAQRDFDDDTVELMSRLRPVLAGVHHAIRTESLRARYRLALRLLAEGHHGRPWCLVTMDDRGRGDHTEGDLVDLVEAAYGPLHPSAPTPSRLRALASSRRRTSGTVVLGPGLRADVTSDAEDSGVGLLFELCPTHDLRTRFGLTDGECRTLANVARYETNDRVAAVEGVSRATIEKRMTAVIHKMGVDSRVGAVREYLRTPSSL